eukprot:11211750-Lingulodinium_polyedra.AAC.1
MVRGRRSALSRPRVPRMVQRARGTYFQVRWRSVLAEGNGRAPRPRFRERSAASSLQTLSREVLRRRRPMWFRQRALPVVLVSG